MAKRSKRRQARGGRRGNGQETVLPDVSTLADVPGWGDLAPTPLQDEAFAAWRGASEDPDGLEEGCVCRLDRGFPAVLTASGPVRAEHAVRIAKEADALKPAVGDWVALRRPAGHDMAVIEEVLPRKSEVARWRGGSRGERQVLAANVDVVLCAQAEGRRGISLDRAARAAQLAAALRDGYLTGCVGQVYDVLYEQPGDGGLYQGHAPNYAAVAAAGTDLHNRVLPTRITGLRDGGLMGEIVG